MKILLIDIESAPTIAGIWRLYDDYVSTDQILEDGYTLCVSAKWFGDRDVKFFSVWKDGRKKMLREIHKLLDEADVVIHYNGIKYDIPHLQREFVEEEMNPPSPAKQVDLFRVVKRQFKFVSNKLDYVCQRLGLGVKVKHKGMKLWWDVMKGLPAATRTMEKYNKRDVVLLERLYKRLMPWIHHHPNHGAYTDGLRCPYCGKTHLQKRGTSVANALRYTRFQCQDCGGWSRSNKPLNNGHRERRHAI